MASTEVSVLNIYPAEVSLDTGRRFQMVAEAKNDCGFTVSTAQVNFRLATQSNVVQVGGDGQVNVLGFSTEPVKILAVLQAPGQGANAAVAPVAATLKMQRGFTVNPVPGCILIFPPGPVEIAESAGSRQLTASAYDTNCTAIARDGTPLGSAKQLPGVPISWRSATPNIATVDTFGRVTVVNPGIATIIAEPAQGSNQGARGEVSVIVRSQDGSSGAAPVLKVTPNRLLLQVDGVATVQAQVINAVTQEALEARFEFRLVNPGSTQDQQLRIAELTPFRDTSVAQRFASASLTGVRSGRAEVLVTARIVANNQLLPSQRILVTGVRLDPTAPDWKRGDDLPYTRGVFGHAMAEMDGYLFTTGGVIGEGAGSGGFTEDVNRAGLLLGDGVGGGTDLWVKSRTKLAGQSSSAPEQVLSEQETVVNFVWPGNPCSQTVDPSTGLLPADCMEILRTASEQQSTSVGNFGNRIVHYQVQGHAMVAAAGYLYVVGGVDGQVDVCVGLSQGQNCQVFTKFSDRTLIGQVDSLTGGVTWSESPFRIPKTAGLKTPSGADAEDKGGRFKPALAVYQNRWVYLLGGWNEVKPIGSNLDPIGINRDEIYRAEIATNGSLSDWVLVGHLPVPTNKHAAAIVGDTLVISGGALGQNNTSAEQVTDKVYLAELDPLTGRFSNPAGGVLGPNEVIPWREGTPLPIPLEYHSMTVVPGDRRLVVAGGDNLISSSAAVFVSTINTAGDHGIWSLFKDLPHLAAGSSGVTAHAATGVSSVEGQAVARVYVSGGGGLASGSNFNLTRRSETYYIDLPPVLP